MTNSTQKSIFLKWPNDLYSSERKKVGGIIAQVINRKVVVGLGLNWGYLDHPLFASVCDDVINDQQKKVLSFELCDYILNNRIAPEDVKKKWEQSCIHMNQTVSFDQGTGIFKGIGSQGEAIIEKEGKDISLFGGGLFI